MKLVTSRVISYLYRWEKSKERLTCAFFVNAKGGKEKPIVVGKSANPRCLKGISDRSTLPCQYFNQRISVDGKWNIEKNSQ